MKMAGDSCSMFIERITELTASESMIFADIATRLGL